MLNKNSIQALQRIVHKQLSYAFENETDSVKLENFIPDVQDFIQEATKVLYLNRFTDKELHLFIDFHTTFAEELPKHTVLLTRFFDEYFVKHSKEIDIFLAKNRKESNA